MVKRIIGALFLLVLMLVFFHDRLVGMLLRPYLERTLTGLFGMPVSIGRLRTDLAGKIVCADNVRFMNQPGFPRLPHLSVKRLEFDLDYPALGDKEVRIRHVLLDQPIYRIDRMSTPDGPRNTVSTWWHHIKGTDNGDKKVQKKSPQAARPQKGWHVLIERFTLLNASFIYDDQSPKGSPKRLVFQHFNGYLTRLEWPVPRPLVLSEFVNVRGVFGEQKLTPFWIRGVANFPTSDVSFRLEGEIEDGLLTEQRALWEGLPIEFKGGTFYLKSLTVCDRKHLESLNTLSLKAVRAVPGTQATDIIWGVPLAASIAFMQNQKVLELEVPVHGDISDPKFEFPRAFVAAFQKSLGDKTQAGLKMLTAGTTKLAAQTGTLVAGTPGVIMSGLGKISSIASSIAVKAPEDN